MAEIITAKQAAELITDRAIIGMGGMGYAGWPNEIAEAIAERYTESKHPENISLRMACFLGDHFERNPDCFAIDGLIAEWNASILGNKKLCNMVFENKIECHCIPQGVAVNLWREIAAHRPGIMTKVGLGTFVDPRIDGGKMNSITKHDAAELINLNGEEYLFFKSFPVDFAILRGSYADEDGNITFSNDGMINEGLQIALAAHNTGGKVILQVEYVAASGSLKPKAVQIPGILVDYIVVAEKPESSWQSRSTEYDPAFSGELRKPLKRIPAMPLTERKIIARRCAMEIKTGNVVNLGVGIPTDIASVAAEEGVSDNFILSTEAGSVGGVPASQDNFGSAYNPQATMAHGAMFDMIDGGGLDITFLGMGEMDRHGNVNVSKFGPQLPGCGGFIDITSATKSVVFGGTFMAKAKLSFADGKIHIDEEGKFKKIVDQVEQITFSAEYTTVSKVLYVTERCVFRLIDKHLVLTEIAPGIDLQRDILDLMDTKPVVSPDLKLMEPGIFYEQWGGLKDIIDVRN